MKEPMYFAKLAEDHPQLPLGVGERFAGYGIMGQPFISGHVLALRRFPATSLGGGYTSVWHCDPEGRWTMWSDAPPLFGCQRYFGPALTATYQLPIGIEWLDPWRLRVGVVGVLKWDTTISSTVSTRLMTAVASHLPEVLWRNRAVLVPMSRMAGPVLRAGAVRLNGQVPSGQLFRVKIDRVWATTNVVAELRDEDLGPPGGSHPQRRLGGFVVPNRGLFAVGSATFESYSADRHFQVLLGTDMQSHEIGG